MNKTNCILTILIGLTLISCSKNENKIKFNKKDNASVSQKAVSSSTIETNNINKLNSSDLNSVIKGEASEAVENVKNNSKIDVTLIPIKFSIQYKNGTGQNQIAVFLDLNQSFSKNFISDISNISNSTVNVFLSNGDQEAIDKIYCSEDQKQSLSAYLNGLKIDNNNRNCNKDGLDYSNKYYQDYLSSKSLPLVIFSDGNFVESAFNANSELINKYLSGN